MNTENYFNIIKLLMEKDGILDSIIYDMQCTLKRDTTKEEEDNIIIKTVQECKEHMKDTSCSLIEAYNDIMY